jgi:hypothetical protein
MHPCVFGSGACVFSRAEMCVLGVCGCLCVCVFCELMFVCGEGDIVSCGYCACLVVCV